jgi:hypothetical protein
MHSVFGGGGAVLHLIEDPRLRPEAPAGVIPVSDPASVHAIACI